MPHILQTRLPVLTQGFHYGAVTASYGAVDIMVTLRCIGRFVGAGVIAASSASFLPRVDSPRPQSTTDASLAMDGSVPSPIPSLVRSLDLPDEQASAVFDVFSDYPTVDEFLTGKSADGSMLTSAACAVLKLVLGEAKVDTTPVNTTLTQENWLVSVASGLSSLSLQYSLEVTGHNHAGSRLAALFWPRAREMFPWL